MPDTQLDLQPTPDDEVGNVEERVVALEGVIGELKRRLDALEEPDIGGPIRDDEPDIGPAGQS